MPPRIPEEAVEKAAAVMTRGVWTVEMAPEVARAALVAAFEALGMTEEKRVTHIGTGKHEYGENAVFVAAHSSTELETRLCSAWVPVSGEQTDRRVQSDD